MSTDTEKLPNTEISSSNLKKSDNDENHMENGGTITISDDHDSPLGENLTCDGEAQDASIKQYEKDDQDLENINDNKSSTSSSEPESGTDNLAEGESDSFDISTPEELPKSFINTANEAAVKQETVPDVPSISAEGAAADASPTGSKKLKEAQCVYHIKWINYKGKQIPVVTQNENGPCPLLAIMNIIFLKEKIKLAGNMELISAEQLMEYLGDFIFEQVPKNLPEDQRLNYEQNINDAMSVLPKLQTGLDINVRFTGVGDIEYTSECIIFDILGIPIYHGWLVDPESPEVVSAVGTCSYNQLVEKIINHKSSDKPEKVTEALIAETFLDGSASQLTYHGLSELGSTIKEDELCVIFRNNHFSTLYRHKNELFLLVTDQGFLRESNVVWETLSNVEGDGHFVDSEFRTYRKPEPPIEPVPLPSVPANSEQQIDQDYLVALSMQQDQQEESAKSKQFTPASPAGDTHVLSDLELARQLQEEENMQAAHAQQQQQQASGQRQTQPPQAPERERKDSCTLL